MRKITIAPYRTAEVTCDQSDSARAVSLERCSSETAIGAPSTSSNNPSANRKLLDNFGSFLIPIKTDNAYAKLK
jgi:hypothetical protein